MARRPPLLPNWIEPRGMTITQAAAHVGLSVSAYAAARARGEYPGPTLPGGRIDRILLERAMDRMSGIQHQRAVDPLIAWEEHKNARST